MDISKCLKTNCSMKLKCGRHVWTDSSDCQAYVDFDCNESNHYQFQIAINPRTKRRIKHGRSK